MSDKPVIAVNGLTFDICPDDGLGFLRHNGALFWFGVRTFQRGKLAVRL